MANIKEINAERIKESASKGKKVDDTLECGDLVTDAWVDDCGCGIEDCECLDLCYCC